MNVVACKNSRCGAPLLATWSCRGKLKNETQRAPLSGRKVTLGRRRNIEKSRTQPSHHIQISRVIPISTTFCPPPIEPILVTGERRTGEDQREPILGVGDVSNHTIDPGVGSRYEWLLNQSRASSKTHTPWCLYGEMTLIAFMRFARAAAPLLSSDGGRRTQNSSFG